MPLTPVPRLDVIPRRFDGVAIAKEPSPASFIAAAIAAALLAAVDVMLFLRVTRCEGLMAPRETECEWCLEEDGRTGKLDEGVAEVDSLCWLAGREACAS